MPPKKFKLNVVEKKIHPNAKYLIIVESPSKCAKIESYLGDQYCCVASVGHIRSLNGLNSIDIEAGFIPRFSIIEDKKLLIESLKDVIAKFPKENIYLASDDDREGEAIAWHICEVFELPVDKTKRILFHEVTKPALQKAIQSPGIMNMNLVKAQHARQVLDVLVGYKVSPFLWKYLYHNKANSLSAGRCQTPALRLVYDNEKEKRTAEIKYRTTATFFSYNMEFDLMGTTFTKEEEVLDFLNKSKTFQHTLSLGSLALSKRTPPKPFNTSRLLQISSSSLNLSPKETMSLCQTLYQNGYITYMRTDSTKYSAVFLDQVSSYIVNRWKKPEYIGERGSLETAGSNPHEAIRVTQIETVTMVGDDKRLNSLYKLIWRNSIESCMTEAKYNVTKVKITAPDDYFYTYSIEIPAFLGWKVLQKEDTDAEKTSALLLYVKSISKPVTYTKINSIITLTKGHSHYTEASLVNTLEDMGIGRPSTFAMLIETIQDRGYVKRMDIEGSKYSCKDYCLEGQVLHVEEKEKILGTEKNKLVIQPVGVATIEFLIEHFENLFSYGYTKTMEMRLDEVSSGENEDWASVCNTCFKEIRELSKPVAKLEKQVYPIDDQHDFVFQKYGPTIRIKAEDGSYIYKAVSKEIQIDLEKLRTRGYTLDELYEIKTPLLGVYQDQNMYLKNGKYGAYVEWGENKESVKGMKMSLCTITLKDVVEFLEAEKPKGSTNILRTLSSDMSIRKGKFGAYVFYQTSSMGKPQFLNIKKFPEGYMACNSEVLIKWLCDVYKL